MNLDSLITRKHNAQVGAVDPDPILLLLYTLESCKIKQGSRPLERLLHSAKDHGPVFGVHVVQSIRKTALQMKEDIKVRWAETSHRLFQFDCGAHHGGHGSPIYREFSVASQKLDHMPIRFHGKKI